MGAKERTEQRVMVIPSCVCVSVCVHVHCVCSCDAQCMSWSAFSGVQAMEVEALCGLWNSQATQPAISQGCEISEASMLQVSETHVEKEPGLQCHRARTLWSPRRQAQLPRISMDVSLSPQEGEQEG